jgi:hypothetical protein
MRGWRNPAADTWHRTRIERLLLPAHARFSRQHRRSSGRTRLADCVHLARVKA